MTNVLNKEQINKVYHAVIRNLNFTLVCILIGTVIGFKIADAYLNYRIDEAIKLQAFVYKGGVYEIKPKL